MVVIGISTNQAFASFSRFHSLCPDTVLICRAAHKLNRRCADERAEVHRSARFGKCTTGEGEGVCCSAADRDDLVVWTIGCLRGVCVSEAQEVVLFFMTCGFWMVVSMPGSGDEGWDGILGMNQS